MQTHQKRCFNMPNNTMKTYLVQSYTDTGRGSIPIYRVMKEKELKLVKIYGDFLNVYELASPRPLSIAKMKELKIPFMTKNK